ncbi:hypothetical protein [Mycoplasma simbae]|uniref:hypothetical protein n=1 Tax=Mycoplasma simbae TaxID=36744 RepID=UPI00049633BC|nr:hypothetical protein [Mycoplasma simbae]
MTNTKTILIYTLIAIIFTVALAIEGLLIYLAIRKNKLQHYKKNIEKWARKIKHSNSNNSATLERFKSISQTVNLPIDLEQKLINLYKQMQNCTKTISPLMQNLNISITKYNLKQAKLIYPKVKTNFQEFVTLNSEFESLSNTLNTHWNTIEIVALNAYEMIKTLEKIIEESKDKIPVSYKSISEELKKLKQQTTLLEQQKESKKIQDVSAELNAHDRRLRTFADKVSHIENMEWLAFKHLPMLYDNIKNIKNQASNLSKLNAMLINIQDNFVNTPYQNTITLIREWLFLHYIIDKTNKNTESFIDFASQNYPTIIQFAIQSQEMLNRIENFIQPTKHSLWQHLLAKTQILIDDLQKAFDSLQSKKTIALIDFQAQLDSVLLLANELNQLLLSLESLQMHHEYNKYYLNIIESWYLSIIAQRASVENSTQNESMFNELVSLHQYIFSSKSQNISVELAKFIEKMQQTYKLITKAKTYEFMCGEIIKKIARYRIENESVDHNINIAIEKINSKNYSQAYRLLINTIKKEKLNVH